MELKWLLHLLHAGTVQRCTADGVVSGYQEPAII
jgi:hypothetical protein